MITGIYYEHMLQKGYSKLTVRGVRSALGLYQSYVRENFHKRITEITQKEIECYISYLLENMERITVAGRVNLLRKFYDYCRKNGHILTDPMSGVDIYLYHDRMPKYIPDEKTVEELLNQPMEIDKEGIRDKAILEIMYSSGLRRNELIELKLGDVDIKEGIVHVRKGKGGKGRVVPAGKTACKWIEKYVKEVRQKRAKRTGEDHLFLTERGESFKGHTLSELVKRYRGRMADGDRITPHSLRHACASHMLKSGASIEIVRKMLGHKRLSTTQIYTRLNPEDLKKAHKRCHPREREKK